MALLFRTELGGGSSIEPYTVIVSLDEKFKGQPVTLTQGTEIMRKTCPMTVPYEVEFKPMNDGVWVASSTTKDGKVVSVDTEPLLEWGTYNVTLESGFNFREWLNRGRVEKTFTSLDDVLADEPTVRQLMTVHDSVDYLVTELSNHADTAQTILDNDICAKWINLRDYALDMLYANANVKAVMDSVDKYGYGEWALIGQVPKMTSNTAPSGEVFGGNSSSSSNLWKAFNQNPSDTAAGFSNINEYWIGYDFTKDVKINSVIIRGWDDGGKDSIKDFNIECSSDKINWEIVYSGQHTEVLGYETFTFDNDKSRRYWRIKCTSGTWAGSNTGGISVLQFYAWGAKGAVPVMTSNTAPYGLAGGSAAFHASGAAYLAFNNNLNNSAVLNTPSTTGDVYYKFTNPVNVKRFKLCIKYATLTGKIGIKLHYSDDNSVWTECPLERDTLDNNEIGEINLVNDCGYHFYWRVTRTTQESKGGIADILQFYGRQLNVSVPKMDNYTTPFGKVIELGYVTGGYEGYRAFDNDSSTYWQSNANYTGMICYNFEKEVLVKNMYSIMRSPNTGVSKLEGSNTGNSNDWHSIYSDNITAGYPNTKSVLINGNLTYKYYRATITRTDDVPQVTELQFYGLDYSEREFEEGSTMKYIYDHGVELETITTTSMATKRTNELFINQTAAGTAACVHRGIDLTPYKLIRAKTGTELVLGSSDTAFGTISVIEADAQLIPSTSRIYNNITPSTVPHNSYFDISSVNAIKDLLIEYNSNSTRNNKLTITEWWLE